MRGMMGHAPGTHSPSGRQGSRDDGCFARLRKEAEAFFAGEKREGGADLYREIERVVAQWLAHRNSLPDTTDPHGRLSRPAGFCPDPFSPTAGRDLLHDFILDCLFEPENPRIFVAFQLSQDIAGFRRWLRILLSRHLSDVIHEDRVRGIVDALIDALDRRFRQRGLVRVGEGRAAYWSQRSWDGGELVVIHDALDSHRRLNEALREILDVVRPAKGGGGSAVPHGYGARDRDRMAGILLARLTAPAPPLGVVTLVREAYLRERLPLLIEAQMPDLFTDSLYLASKEGAEDDDFEEREIRGVPHSEVSDACDAVEAVLKAMETLVLGMPPSRPGGTSGADARRVMRLYFAGATSSHEAARAWRAEPYEGHGSRPVTMASMLECMPTGPSVTGRSHLRQRLDGLLEAIRDPGFTDLPRSHVTVGRLRDEFWRVWSEASGHLGSGAGAEARRWLVDLLFLEVGRHVPDGATADSLAVADTDAARAAATAAEAALRRKASRDGFKLLLGVVDVTHAGVSPRTIAESLGVDVGSVVRLRAAGRDIVNRTWERRELLPGQRELAEQMLFTSLRVGPDRDGGRRHG